MLLLHLAVWAGVWVSEILGNKKRPTHPTAHPSHPPFPPLPFKLYPATTSILFLPFRTLPFHFIINKFEFHNKSLITTEGNEFDQDDPCRFEFQAEGANGSSHCKLDCPSHGLKKDNRYHNIIIAFLLIALEESGVSGESLSLSMVPPDGGVRNHRSALMETRTLIKYIDHVMCL